VTSARAGSEKTWRQRVTRNHGNHTTTWPLLSHSNRKKAQTIQFVFIFSLHDVDTSNCKAM